MIARVEDASATYVYWSPNAGETPGAAFLRVALVADVGPQFVAFDPMDAKPDHHTVVQFSTAPADIEWQPSDRLAVGIGETTNSALADAFASRPRGAVAAQSLH
jgi:hypothetical protein